MIFIVFVSGKMLEIKCWKVVCCILILLKFVTILKQTLEMLGDIKLTGFHKNNVKNL